MNIIKNYGFQPLDSVYLPTGNHNRKPAATYGYLTKELSENAIKNKSVIVKLKKHDNKIYNLWDYVNNRLNRIRNLKAQEYEKELSERLGEASERIEMERKELQMKQLIAHFKNSLFSDMAKKASKELLQNEIYEKIKQDETLINEELRANNLISEGVELNEIRTSNNEKIEGLEARLLKYENEFNNQVLLAKTEEDIQELAPFAEKIDYIKELIKNSERFDQLETIQEEDLNEELMEKSFEEVDDEVKQDYKEEQIQQEDIMKTKEEMEKAEQEFEEYSSNKNLKTQEEKEILKQVKNARSKYLSTFSDIESSKTDLKHLTSTFKLAKNASVKKINSQLKKITKNSLLSKEDLGSISLNDNRQEKIGLIKQWVKQLKVGNVYKLDDFVMKTERNLIKNIDFKKKNIPAKIAKDNGSYATLGLQQRQDALKLYNTELSKLLNIKIEQPTALTTTPKQTSDFLSEAQTPNPFEKGF